MCLSPALVAKWPLLASLLIVFENSRRIRAQLKHRIIYGKFSIFRSSLYSPHDCDSPTLVSTLGSTWNLRSFSGWSNLYAELMMSLCVFLAKNILQDWWFTSPEGEIQCQKSLAHTNSKQTSWETTILHHQNWLGEKKGRTHTAVER